MQSSYVEEFKYELLDNQDRFMGNLTNIAAGGSLDFSVSANVKGQGSISLTKTKDIDWLHSRVRVSYNNEPLITAVPSIPSENYDSTSVTMEVDLLDKTSILAGDNFGGMYTVAAGTNIIAKVIEVIQSTGETKVAIDPSSLVLASAITWDANATKLNIVNDLLSAANYWSVWTNGLGYFRSYPYLAPSYRPVMHNFVDDAQGLYLPAFTRNYDPFNVPNRYVVLGKTDGGIEAVRKEATDTTLPYGYPYRPWLTTTEADVDYSDDATLQAIANRKLADAQQVTETFEFSHPFIKFGLNDVVTFTNSKLGTRTAVVQKQTYSLQTGGLVKSTIRSLNV